MASETIMMSVCEDRFSNNHLQSHCENESSSFEKAPKEETLPLPDLPILFSRSNREKSHCDFNGDFSHGSDNDEDFVPEVDNYQNEDSSDTISDEDATDLIDIHPAQTDEYLSVEEEYIDEEFLKIRIEECKRKLRCMEQFAVVLHFFDLFKGILEIQSTLETKSCYSIQLGNFSPPKECYLSFAELLEESLIKSEWRKTAFRRERKFICNLHITLLKNIMKKKEINEQTWQSTCSNKITKELRNGNCTLDENPFLKYALEPKENIQNTSRSSFLCPYFKLPLQWKVKLLKALCEWQLDYCEKLQNFLRSFEQSKEIDGKLREQPLGYDANGNIYWCLDTNEITARVYRERPPKWTVIENSNLLKTLPKSIGLGTPKNSETTRRRSKPNAKRKSSNNKDRVIVEMCLVEGSNEWETVSTTIRELQELSDSLNSTENEERMLCETIKEELLPPLFDEEKRKESAVKKIAKLEIGGVSVKNIIVEGRARKTRKEVNYAYVDDDDFDCE